MGCGAAGRDGHDRNGDGVFNVQDYIDTKKVMPLDLPTFSAVCDTRVLQSGDVNMNAILDPQDLIAAFSDGKDGDANGYIDDISGWDFYHDDNDPYDDTQFGHGDGESEDSASQGNNGRGDIGTCPDCTVQLLRVGDSFVTDASMFGMATLYAVDIGGSVVQEALGTIDDTLLAREALDYAYRHNVAVIASAADENSYHHNKPGTNNHAYYVHAITFDTNEWRQARTFLNFNNCTNYGSNLLASVPAATCSSGAVGRLAGIAGLVYAAALEADIPYPQSDPAAGDTARVRRLTAEEVYQVLSTSADDLHDPADATDPTRYPTRVGWDQRFGYGRINARSAVDMVMADKLPPEVEIRDPEWYQVVFPEQTPKVKIDGRVHVSHTLPGDTVDWVLEWAPGTEPDEQAFQLIAQATMIPGKDGIDGPLGDWDISALKIDNATQGPPDDLVNRRMVTLRLRAVIHSMGPREGARGEARRAVFVEREPDLVAGFPVRLRTSGEMSGKMVDPRRGRQARVRGGRRLGICARLPRRRQGGVRVAGEDGIPAARGSGGAGESPHPAGVHGRPGEGERRLVRQHRVLARLRRSRRGRQAGGGGGQLLRQGVGVARRRQRGVGLALHHRSLHLHHDRQAAHRVRGHAGRAGARRLHRRRQTRGGGGHHELAALCPRGRRKTRRGVE